MENISENMKKNIYDLEPRGNQKSFGGKAKVLKMYRCLILYSYGKKVLTLFDNGRVIRHWDGWSATTGRHIVAFSGLNKAHFQRLPVGENVAPYAL